MSNAGWKETLRNNFRYAARRLRQRPAFAAEATLTLALGIGANVAAFTVVRAILLNPLPCPHSEQPVRVYDDSRGSNSRDIGLSAPELWELRDKSDVSQDISALGSADANPAGGNQPERIELLLTGPNYFTMLEAQPQAGRAYTRNDEQPGFIHGIVLSYGFWRRAFGADQHAVGKKNPLGQ